MGGQGAWAPPPPTYTWKMGEGAASYYIYVIVISWAWGIYGQSPREQAQELRSINAMHPEHMLYNFFLYPIGLAS